MLPGVDALWQALGELAVPQPEEAKVVPCVRLRLEDGGAFDVYKAEEKPRHVTLWEVRGFQVAAGESDSVERKAVIMGTKDGRAFLNTGDAMVVVTEHEAATRPLSDLSEVIAAAVRRLLDDAPS